MTLQQIVLVQQSFVKVEPIAGPAADIFYKRLFEIAPQVRPLFPDDMKEQKRKLMTMLGVAVNGLNRLDTILPAVQELGRRHIGYGAQPEHYSVVGEALFFTLGQGLGDDFDEETSAAWSEAYGLLSGAMIAAGQEAAA